MTRDGYWREKDEMSQAYAERATGDYLWQVDVDEFYMPADIEAVLHLLRTEPGITAVSFNTITFWGAPEYQVDSWYLRRGAAEYHRLFQVGSWLPLCQPSSADGYRRRRAGPAIKNLEKGGGDGSAWHSHVPLFLVVAQASAGEMRLLQPRRVGAAPARAGLGARLLFVAEASLSPA